MMRPAPPPTDPRRWAVVCLMACLILPSRAFPDVESGINLEAMASDDIALDDIGIYLLLEKSDYRTVATYNHSDYWIDYRPPAAALVGMNADRYTSTNALRIATQGPLGEDLLWFAECGGYVGFADYQSLWIDEYYRQNFESYPGYEDSDPMGVDGVLALRWDYLQTSGFFKASVFGGTDRIPPQWEADIGKPLTSTDATVQLIGTRLELENVLTTRLRTHNSLTVVSHTSRSPRWSLETMDNYALTDSWVLRGTLGASLENPDFRAGWATLSAEWDSRQTWFLGLNLRYYSDSGDTNDLTYYGVTAPPATTFGANVSVRWSDGPRQASLSLGPYWTNYEQKENTSPVSVLFEDRSWMWLQAAWSYRF